MSRAYKKEKRKISSMDAKNIFYTQKSSLNELPFIVKFLQKQTNPVHFLIFWTTLFDESQLLFTQIYSIFIYFIRCSKP